VSRNSARSPGATTTTTGRPDILLSGTNASSSHLKLLQKQPADGTFTDIIGKRGLTWDTSTEVFPGLVNGRRLGDYNNDGLSRHSRTGGNGLFGD